MNEHDADDTTGSGFGFTGLTAFGPASIPTTEDDRLAPGTRLGDVTIVRFIAEGGMGCVYEGRQERPFRTVAVKVLRPGTLSPTAAKRFLHEAELLGRLTHPGIAQIHSVGMHRTPAIQVPFFVMEFVEAALPITEHAAARSLSIHGRVGLFREACRAVAHGHQRGVIHRDLKPRNLLVDGVGHPKVIDFGVARSTDGDLALTTMHTDVGHLVGTLRYMSPEQFEESADEIDVRADVYSLGIVLYELLAGRPPYDVAGRPIHQVARVIREIDPPRLGTVDRRLRGDLETIVATCLDKDRSRRYSSAAELEADLGRWLAGKPIAAVREGLSGALMRLARRHRLAAASAAAVLAALILGSVGVTVFAVKAERARQEAADLANLASEEREAAQKERDRADAEAETAKRLLAVANLRSIQAALADGNREGARQILAETSGLVASPPPLEIRCLAAEVDDATRVIRVGGPVSNVGYSADGRILAVTWVPLRATELPPGPLEIVNHPQMRRSRADESISFYALDRLEADAPPVEAPEDDGWAIAWKANAGISDGTASARISTSVDGSRDAVRVDQGKVGIVERATGRQLCTLDASDERLRGFAFTPTGSRCAAFDIRGALLLWDAGDGRLIARLADTGGTVGSFRFSPDGSRIAALVSLQGSPDAIVVCDAADGRQLTTITLPNDYLASRLAIAFSHDGRRLVAHDRLPRGDVFDATTGAALGRFTDHGAPFEVMAFSHDGRWCAAGTATGRIVLWNATTMAALGDRVGHEGAIQTLAFHPDGDSLASGSIDGTVRTWRIGEAAPLATLPIASGVTATAFSPDGSVVAIAVAASTGIDLWDARRVERIATLAGSEGHVADIAWSPDGSLVAAACELPAGPGATTVWRADTQAIVSTLPGHAAGAIGVAFAPEGSPLVTTAGDGLVMAWDPRDGRRLWVSADAHHAPRDRLRAVVVRDGGAVAHGTPQLLDATTGAVLCPLRNLGRITCLAPSPDGSMLAMGVSMGTTYLSSTQDGSVLASAAGHVDAVRSLAFSRDGARIAVGSLDGTARLWDVVATGLRAGHALTGHGGSVEAVAFTPDGGRFVTAASDGNVRLWDPALGRLLCTLPGPDGPPRTVAIAPDGRSLLAGTATGGLRLWGLTNAEITEARRGSGPGVGLGLGQVGAANLRRGLRQGGEEGGEIGQFPGIEAEGRQVR